MKILMIGGTGTISFDATKYFLECGHDVYLLNRGHRNVIEHPNIHYIIGNANDKNSLSSALDGQTFDTIFDFIIFNPNQMKERVEVYNGKCKQFVFISSATAYQLVSETITEDTPLGNNVWKYSREKAQCETYLNENKDKWSFYYTIIRPYVTYDNRRLPFPVVTKSSYYSLVDRIIEGKPIIICGDGNNKLTLTHTKDFAVALEGLIMNPAAVNQAFHITGDTVTDWNEILSIICKQLNVKAAVVYMPTERLAELFPSESAELLYDKSCDHVFDNSKIKKAVPAFASTIDVKQGISETVDNLVSNQSLHKIDYTWDDIIDVIISTFTRNDSTQQYAASLKSRIVYFLCEKKPNRVARKVIKKLYHIRGGV